MTDIPNSSAQTRSGLFWVSRLWRSLQARHAERTLHRKLNEALCELNAPQLRDIGFDRGEFTNTGNYKTSSEHPRDRATIIEMTF